MPAHLEIIDGPAKGLQIPLGIGKTISVGRSKTKSMVAIPDDDHLSGQHFSAGLRNGNVYLCNLSKTNPTEVNRSANSIYRFEAGRKFQSRKECVCLCGRDESASGGVPSGWMGFSDNSRGLAN